ncbi:MAG: hypothetical protein JKY70_15440 [Mucilaginibacter sp.]|nr:hypothetical protein [Mucilaginibacter sp.]
MSHSGACLHKIFWRSALAAIIVSIALLCQAFTAIAQTNNPKADQILAAKRALWAKMAMDKLNAGPKDSIIEIKNLRTQKDSAKINEVVAIKIATQRNINIYTKLLINGIPVENLKPLKAVDGDKTVFFKLDKKVQSQLVSYLESTPFESTIMPVYFSVGADVKINLAIKDTAFVKSLQPNGSNTVVKDVTVQVPVSIVAKAIDPVYVEVKQKVTLVWIYIAAIAVAVITVWGLYRNMLKDNANLYYSLANTQLFFWTILFVIAYLRICFKTDTLPDIPLSVLGILGISVTTTAVSKLIDKNPSKAPVIDVNAKSEGLITDILSDGASINIQRFQNVAFNLFFGVLFLQKAFSNNLIPDFDQNVLLLLGVSAGAYAGLKNTEPAKEQTDMPADTVEDRAEVAKAAEKDQQEQQQAQNVADAGKAPDIVNPGIAPDPAL